MGGVLNNVKRKINTRKVYLNLIFPSYVMNYEGKLQFGSLPPKPLPQTVRKLQFINPNAFNLQ